MYSPLRKVQLYWHTIKHLRREQITGRIRFRLAKPSADLSVAPALRAAEGDWVLPASRTVSMTGQSSFVFLGEAGDLSADGWDDPARSKLWRYNLHYFDDLNAIDAKRRRDWHCDFIARWISGNPPPVRGSGGSGWEPYPTSLRIVNWVKWVRSGGELNDVAVQSLAVQARWITQRLEWHILGNHLFVNAKALILAASFFDGPEAESWMETGADILLARGELDEQILSDGGQFELTPMYHALAVEDLLDLINSLQVVNGTWSPHAQLVADKLVKSFESRLTDMLQWMQVMAHPDDKISFFNDAAFGIAPELLEIKRYAAEMGFESVTQTSKITHLSASGYARLESGPAVLLTDVGQIGPSYLPGHAHADSLSFELSLFGNRFFVNCGTSEYGLGHERLRQRGTSSHNTVVVDGEDSSEVWSGFRVARRASVADVTVKDNSGVLTVSATHDGYTRFKSGPHHTRVWELCEGGLKVEDRLSSSNLAEARFHLHPGIEVSSGGKMVLPSGQIVIWEHEGGKAYFEQSTWHPKFGSSMPNQCLVVRLQNGYAALTIKWC